MTESLIFSGCGTICNDCEYYKGEKSPQCTGCNQVKGKPFWGECKLYACIIKHEVEHCGLCDEFPCDLFINQYDPSHGPSSAVLRAGLLAYRAKHGDLKTVKLARSILT
jgi:hypothetical protein